MGSATRNALAAAKDLLAAQGDKVATEVGEGLLAASRLVGSSGQLKSSLADPAVPHSAKTALVDRVFGSLSKTAKQIISQLASSRWSDQDDFVSGIEELGFRSLAVSAGKSADIPSELFAFGQLISSNGDLELAVSSKLGDPDSKAKLVLGLLKGKVSAEASAIIEHLVRFSRGRRIGATIRSAQEIVADQSKLVIATVTVAKELNSAQVDRLRKGLASRFGDPRIQQILDPSIIGGVRINVGGVVIDDTVATRLRDLKLQLAK